MEETMPYVEDKKDPQLLFVIENDSERSEVDLIRRMVDSMNGDLEDSGFGNYSYYVEEVNGKVYVRRDIKLL